ncbi:MAG: DICT sensory domain-containing protein [Phototrophicaceae bacterium]
MTHQSQPLNLSLFDLLIDHLGDTLPIVRATKTTLVHLSHALEDIVLEDNLPALIFTGFQESSYWVQETARYNQLAQQARQVCIFSGGPLPPEEQATELRIQLANGDQLRQEWFLAVLSPNFSALLCGQDAHNRADTEAFREFDTIWTFDPRHINPVLDLLESVVEHYRPDRLETLRMARREFPPTAPDPHLVTRLTLDLVRFEEKLHRQLRWQSSLVETALASITHHLYVFDFYPDGRADLIYLSPNFGTLTGRTHNELTSGWDYWYRYVVHPDDYDIAIEHDTRQRRGESTTCDYRIQHTGGRVMWVRDSTRVVEEGDGLRRVYGVIEDITERKAAEEAQREHESLRLALEAEKELNAFKTYFMSTVSHEFRTPLATILSACELLERYEDRMSSEDRATRYENIRQQVVRLGHMLDDIGMVVSGHIDRLGFNPQQVDLHSFMQSYIQDQQANAGSRHRLTLEYSGPADDISLDSDLLRHILNGLTSNAFRYSPPGSEVSVWVSVAAHEVRIEVADQGLGIPPQDRSHVFKALHRSSNVAHLAGVGLGLKIVHDCVKLHRGTIDFDSQPDEGTTFVICLPTA